MRSPSSLADRSSALVVWTLAWRLASAAAALALSRVLTQGLGVGGYGRYALVVNILVSLQLLATAGQDQALLRYLPELLARWHRAGIADLLRKVAITMVLAWATVAVAVLAARPWIEAAVRVRIGDSVALGAALLLAGVAAGVLSFGLVALHDMRSQAIAVLVGGGVSVALAWLLLRRGGGVAGALVAGAAGQGVVALCYAVVLGRSVQRRTRPLAPAGPGISWRRLLTYAAGWLPNLLFASFVAVQFENFFLARFAGAEAVAFYDIGFFIPQRLITLIPSLLVGAWVVGTVETAILEQGRLAAAVRAFYQALFLLAAPFALLAAGLLPAGIVWFYGAAWAPAAAIAPALVVAFAGALLAVPWGLVVRFRELNALNAALGGVQVLLALVTDYALIRLWKLNGAVAAVGVTTALTVAFSFAAWRVVDRSSLVLPWRYLLRCSAAASPFGLTLLGAALGAPFWLQLALAALALPAWAWQVRRLRLLGREEMPLLYESRHPLVRSLLRGLGPDLSVASGK